MGSASQLIFVATGWTTLATAALRRYVKALYGSAGKAEAEEL
jgi:hypothetical protein